MPPVPFMLMRSWQDIQVLIERSTIQFACEFVFHALKTMHSMHPSLLGTTDRAPHGDDKQKTGYR